MAGRFCLWVWWLPRASMSSVSRYKRCAHRLYLQISLGLWPGMEQDRSCGLMKIAAIGVDDSKNISHNLASVLLTQVDGGKIR